MSRPSASFGNPVPEASTNLVGWAPLAMNVAAGTALRYTDAESKNLPYRFYRARPAP